MAESDTSDEDLSKFQDVVDNCLPSLLTNNSVKGGTKYEMKKKSERYLNTESHYNDVVIPKELQLRIGQKISNIIAEKFKFINVDNSEIESNEALENGGIKLFTNSKGFLSAYDAPDLFTDAHNKKCREYKQRKRKCDKTIGIDNCMSVAVNAEYILAGEETKHWKSRRKEKLYKYSGEKKNEKIIANLIS